MTKPALFLDRDGVINVDVGYAHKPEQIQFMPGVFDLVRSANSLSMPVVVVTNQSGIGRGFYTDRDFHALMDWMRMEFSKRGACLDHIEHCPHLPEPIIGKEEVCCDCRKPKPGMFYRAKTALDIDLSKSYMVGDNVTDLQASTAAGIQRNYLLRSPKYPMHDLPDFCVPIHGLSQVSLDFSQRQ
jgi:D-glycero-D-manno-heptose 1,7-bisphosphate phosphatase